MADMLEKLNKMVEAAKARPITKGELQQQRAAFAYGNLPRDSQTTRADVKRALELMEGAD